MKNNNIKATKEGRLYIEIEDPLKPKKVRETISKLLDSDIIREIDKKNIDMSKKVKLKDETANGTKPVLADSYFCGVDFGNGNSQGAFTVFKDGKLVWHTRKMWKAKLYIWWKQIWHKAFAIFFVRRMYVITQMKAGVKCYYMGEDSKWTPFFEGAKQYKKKPDFNWISDLWHKVEEYYA